jgi:hypothetical protein
MRTSHLPASSLILTPYDICQLRVLTLLHTSRQQSDPPSRPRLVDLEGVSSPLPMPPSPQVLLWIDTGLLSVCRAANKTSEVFILLFISEV